MSDERTQRNISDERSFEIQYIAEIARKDGQRVDIALPQNRIWTTGGQAAHMPSTLTGELIGRVALESPSDVIDGGSSFYIGARHAIVGDTEVFSWAAPVACTFFRRKETHHELCETVAVVRTFTHARDQIVDFEDEALVESPPRDPFGVRELKIPTAPAKPKLPTLASKPVDHEGERPEVGPNEIVPRTTQPKPSPALLESMRASRLVLERLQRPREGQLRSVLSTMQPDQYELATLPASASRIIQGHPGTGKTIVAAHRVAYLLNHKIPHDHMPLGGVLLVGPTREYGHHVRGVIEGLTDDSRNFAIRSIGELLTELTGLPPGASGGDTNSWQDADEGLGRWASRAVAIRKQQGPMPASMPDAIASVYSILKANGSSAGRPTQDLEWTEYFRSLPEFASAKTARRLRPLLGFIAIRLGAKTSLRQVGHVVIDEAQDLHALEWAILDHLNKGGWTILGDVNQRRTDHSPSSWEKVANSTGMLDAFLKAPVVTLERGYRSTKAIMKYASALLPRAERELFSLQQDGPEPTVDKVSDSKLLAGRVMLVASEMLERHPSGTVAVIATDPSPIGDQLRRDGWALSPNSYSEWSKRDRTISLLVPYSARGLEFDAVVVVEPASFPKNYGRFGPLYTALTRANRELAVVHFKPLVDELKRFKAHHIVLSKRS